MSSRPVIDLCGVAYDEDCWRAYFLSFAQDVPGYLRFFGPSLAHNWGADPTRYARALERSPEDAVDVLIDGGLLTTTPDAHAASLREQGVVHQVLMGGSGDLPGGDSINQRIASWVATDPDLFESWAGLDPRDPDAAVTELDTCVREYGMRGAAITPFWQGVDPNGAECHRIYARCVELGIPIWIHTGMNLASNRPLASSTWTDIDLVAVAHPDLVIVAGHGGWPWILEGMAVLQRHPNVYLEFSAHRPRIMGRTGSGWEPMLFYGKTLVRHKILFGSAAWVHRVTIADLAAEVEGLGLGDDVTDAWLHGNAARVLGLSDRVVAAV
jgi:uncharacterized protein